MWRVPSMARLTRRTLLMSEATPGLEALEAETQLVWEVRIIDQSQLSII